MWVLSSVGRASPLQGEGHWFKPSRTHHLIVVLRLRRKTIKERLWGLLAQLVEQLTFNQLVEGSNPSQPTTFLLLFLTIRDTV